MNIFQLQCFLAVAGELNFARAAERMHVTQPAVTQQIHTLEKELGVKLFKRTTRVVRLTEEGFLFLVDAQRMVDLSERAIKRFNDPERQEVRTFSIGCYGYTPLFALSPVLRDLVQKHPDLHPRLRAGHFAVLRRLLEDEDIDVLLGFRETETKKIAASYREVAKVPIVCIGRPETGLAGRTHLHLDDLRTQKLILLYPERAQADVAQIQGQLIGGRASSDLYFCESAEAGLVLAEAGLGVVILPDLFIPSFPSFVRLPLEGVRPVSFGAYYTTLAQNSPLRDFLQILRDTLTRLREDTPA